LGSTLRYDGASDAASTVSKRSSRSGSFVSVSKDDAPIGSTQERNVLQQGYVGVAYTEDNGDMRGREVHEYEREPDTGRSVTSLHSLGSSSSSSSRSSGSSYSSRSTHSARSSRSSLAHHGEASGTGRRVLLVGAGGGGGAAAGSSALGGSRKKSGTSGRSKRAKYATKGITDIKISRKSGGELLNHPLYAAAVAGGEGSVRVSVSKAGAGAAPASSGKAQPGAHSRTPTPTSARAVTTTASGSSSFSAANRYSKTTVVTPQSVPTPPVVRESSGKKAFQGIGAMLTRKIN
jgi:hypothetical protein